MNEDCFVSIPEQGKLVTNIIPNYPFLKLRINECHDYYIQSTLGFETLDKAAALGLETATPLTDPRQYINSNLGFSKFDFYIVK